MNKAALIEKVRHWRDIISHDAYAAAGKSIRVEETSRSVQRFLCNAIISQMLASRGILDAGPQIPDDASVLCVPDEVLSKVNAEIAELDLSEFPFEVLSDIYESYLAERSQRKGKGIYYTPLYIVRYIVDQTLGRYLWGTENGRPEGDMPVKNPEGIRNLRVLDPACGSGSFLSYAFDVLAEFYDSYSSHTGTDWLPVILERHLFGIDLDSDAVDITNTILILKVLERMDHAPDTTLKLNIKRGNFLTGETSEILNAEVFTMILGNPPYGAYLTEPERRLIKANYETHKSPDSSSLFVEKAVKKLENRGILGFIVPKSLSYVVSWRPIREFLLNQCTILEFADAREAFRGVLLEQMVMIAQKCYEAGSKTIVSILNSEQSSISHTIDDAVLSSERFSIWISSRGLGKIISRMRERSVPLGLIADIWSGLNIQRLSTLSDTQDSEYDCPCLRGRNIQRYHIRSDIKYMKTADITSSADRFRRSRIVAQDIVAHIKKPTPRIKLTNTIERSQNRLNLNTVTNIASSQYHLEYICGILNSRLVSWYTYDFIYNRAVRTMHFRSGYADHIPIPQIDQNSPIYAQFIRCVDRMLALCHEEPTATSKIARLDRRIEQLVYELYGLTNEDIAFLRKHAGLY